MYLVDGADVSKELTITIFRVENEPLHKNGMDRGQNGSGIDRVRIRQIITIVIIGVIYLVRPTTFSIPSPITYFTSFIHLYFLGFPVFSYVTHFDSSYTSFINFIIHLRTALDTVTISY